CGYACPLTVTDMLTLQQQLPVKLRERTMFGLVSFDVARDTPAALAKYRARRQLGANWILLHGDEGSVRELAALLGVQYRETADGSFTHSNQLTILNPEGEIVYRRTGLQGGLAEAAQALAQNTP
ncbi:MAG: SCO family protein, partial [Streptosporangiaceae bacterium]